MSATDVARWVVHGFTVAVAVWQFRQLIARKGGWRAIPESGALWFVALGVAGLTGVFSLDGLRDGYSSMEARVLVALGTFACFGAGLVGIFWRLEQHLQRRCLDACDSLRADGFLAASADAPLPATEEQLLALEDRLDVARSGWFSVPDYKRRRLGDMLDLIDRDLQRVQEARRIMDISPPPGIALPSSRP